MNQENIVTETQTRTIDVIRESIIFLENGNLLFKVRSGRGSGAPVVIPSNQVDEFVDLLNQFRDSRTALTNNS